MAGSAARWRQRAVAGRCGGRAALPLVCLALACSKERPWDGPLDGSVVDETQPWLPSQPDGSWLTDGHRDGGPTATATAGGMQPVPTGGLWVSCYGGFHPSEDPLRDVTRLGLVCGPPNGMKPAMDEPLQGEVAQGKPPQHHPLQVRRGECYRVFAVAAAGVADLDVAVQSSRGTRLATDASEDRWPIVHPDRPLCTFDDDRFDVAVRAERGAGRYALTVWKLPAQR